MKKFIQFLKDLWNGHDMPGPSSKGVVYEEPPTKSYVSSYDQRTAFEHTGIRSVLKIDPEKCGHLKGGQFRKFDTSVVLGPKPERLDYNVSMHTFIDGSKRIRCLTCGRCWYQNTDKDWNEAIKMVNQSTNMPTSTEVPYLRARLSQGGYRYYHNKEEVKKDFPNRNGNLGPEKADWEEEEK